MLEEVSKVYIDKLAWIHIKDRKILSTRSFGKDVYYIPGGKRDGAETDQQALIREIQEELSVDLRPDSIRHFGTFEAQAHGKPEGTLVRMTCYEADFQGELKPSHEIEEMIWLTFADKLKSSPVDQLIFDYLKEHNLID